MKTTLIWMAMALTAASMTSAQPARVFALVAAGDVNASTMERIRDYMADQTGAEVRLRDPLPGNKDIDLEAVGREAVQTLQDDEFALIVAARSQIDQPQGLCRPAERFGCLNVDRLHEGVDEDRFVRRAGQDGLRVMALLLDMSPCPFHLCVLRGLEKTEDLDQMSGNYCPPCQERFTRLARQAGVLRRDGGE